MSKAPSAILSDALTSFNRAATLAFTAAQDQARNDLTRANADAREARKERDEAVNALHVSKLEEQTLREEVGVWKSTADQAALTINHHLETIAQLRQEATQWKDQCFRLEDTSRHEAISWKEQFLRVEKERSKLAQRVEELVAEQLSSGGRACTSTAPYTPMPKHSAYNDMSASTRLPRVSAVQPLSPGQGKAPPKSVHSTTKTTSSANRNRPGPPLQFPTPLSEGQRTRQRAVQEAAPLTSQTGKTSNNPRQIVIRRVQAVVEVPVKEESVDPEDLGQDTHISTAASNVHSTSSLVPKSTSSTKTSKGPTQTAQSNKATSRAKRKATLKRPYVEIDDESEVDDAQCDGEEYRPVSDDDDDDDELLINPGVERNHKVYSQKHVPQQRAHKTGSSTASERVKAHPPSKKTRPSTALKS